MLKAILRLLLYILLAAVIITFLLLATGIGIGYLLYWLLPDMSLDIAILTGVVAAGSLFIFSAILLKTPFSIPLPDNDYDDDDDEGDKEIAPHRPIYIVRETLPPFEEETKPKKRRRR